MFIQNRAKRIAQKLNAKNIAPLIRRISALREKIAESTLKSPSLAEVKSTSSPSLAEGDKGGGYNSKIIAESQIDSSLRGARSEASATKQSIKSNAKNTHPLTPSAREGEFLDCHDSASQNLTITENSALDSANQTKNAESSLNCHTERSEISQNRDFSPTAQNDNFNLDYLDCHDSATQNLAMTESNADSANPQNQNLDSANYTKFAESRVQIDDIIRVDSANLRNCEADSAELLALLKDLKPWRKGPFEVCGVEIQSEWNSAIKFNIIKNHLNITGKAVADIGCNNGYYAFRLLPLHPAKIVGFEPSAFCKMQFDLINAFIKSEICFEMLGVEDLAEYDCKFDCILCLGVLYHRTNPIDCLRILKNALNKGGEIFVDTLIIEGSGELVLSPLSYAKMKNVYFIPSIGAFQNWMRRAGFREIELLEVRKTTSIEQRKTAWSGGESLEDFLDKDDKNKTIEGYNAPIRAYFKAKI
ncbi:tRNA 5-methoxyuridine(34)/uridine 5-oxyacetic acid(34) synthase CmoB [Helicobacter sp. 23-1044]